MIGGRSQEVHILFRIIVIRKAHYNFGNIREFFLSDGKCSTGFVSIYSFLVKIHQLVTIWWIKKGDE